MRSKFFGAWSSLTCALSVTIAVIGGNQAQAVVPPYDSVTQIIVDGVIDDGLILVKPGTRDVESLIEAQLKYMLGQLNWEDAAPKLSRFDIEVEEMGSVDEETGLVPVHYKARGPISWSRKQGMPDQMKLILPARGDESGLTKFVDRYFHKCTNDPHAERRGYFFFFYPKLKTCPMSSSSENELEREKGMVVRFKMRFEESDANTRGKSPEYGRLWEDGKLTVTAIFGKYEKTATSAADEGILAYNQFHSLLLNNYGQPRQAERDGRHGWKLVWNFGDKKLEVRLQLVSALASVGDSFISWYQQRTQDSDVVIYSGHAGLGDNVDVLINHAVFKPKRYQIFFINGCDTFTYVNEELFAAHAAVNPGAPASKYLDIITNSVSNYFKRMADSSFVLVNELVRAKKTYREILGKIDPSQRAIVDGEEDNTWPTPFRDWPASSPEVPPQVLSAESALH